MRLNRVRHEWRVTSNASKAIDAIHHFNRENFQVVSIVDSLKDSLVTFLMGFFRAFDCRLIRISQGISQNERKSIYKIRRKRDAFV